MRGVMMAAMVAFVVAAAPAARAAEAEVRVGTVIAVTGAVEIGSAGAWRPAAPELELFEGQAIRTGEGASVEVLFDPDTPARLGASSEIGVADLLLKARLEQTRAKLVRPTDTTRAEMKLTPLTGVRGTEASEEKAEQLKREHYWGEGQAPETE